MMKKNKKSHGIQLLLRAVVKDPDGKVISDTGLKKSKSFVENFLKYVYCVFDLVTRTALDTSGSVETLYNVGDTAGRCAQILAPIANSSYGLVIGTGDTAPTNTDNKLEIQLTHGVGAGQISHGEVTLNATAVVGANVDLETIRSFTNNTGSTITVKEAGAYVMTTWGGSGKRFMIIRDVVGPTEIPDKCSLTVYYVLRTVV